MRLLLFALALLTLPVAADPVVKCETAGKTAYTDQVCVGGKPLQVQANPAAGDVANAKQRARQEKAELAKIDKQREKEVAAHKRAYDKAARQTDKKQKKCAQLKQRAERARDGERRATGKKLDKARQKSRQSAQRYEQACKQ